MSLEVMHTRTRFPPHHRDCFYLFTFTITMGAFGYGIWNSNPVSFWDCVRLDRRVWRGKDAGDMDRPGEDWGQRIHPCVMR